MPAAPVMSTNSRGLEPLCVICFKLADERAGVKQIPRMREMTQTNLITGKLKHLGGQMQHTFGFRKMREVVLVFKKVLTTILTCTTY
jgi:hypothetical protein